jgi:hypothetical protein
MKRISMILLILFVFKSTFADNPKQRIISLKTVTFDTIINDYNINYSITDNKDKNKPKDAPAMKEVNGQQFIDFGKENQILREG